MQVTQPNPVRSHERPGFSLPVVRCDFRCCQRWCVVKERFQSPLLLFALKLSHSEYLMATIGALIAPYKAMAHTQQYPKGDLRRMLSVLAAIDTPQGSSLVRIAADTGLDKKTVTSLIEQARVQADVSIEKSGATYRITGWGRIIKKSGARLALTGAFNAPTMEP